ncbi:MAG TPA: hypothetical protein VMB70_00750 [Terriglobia bacterium]|nr:hypothetical protein [Terriglobia bacterium]
MGSSQCMHPESLHRDITQNYNEQLSVKTLVEPQDRIEVATMA